MGENTFPFEHCQLGKVITQGERLQCADPVRCDYADTIDCSCVNVIGVAEGACPSTLTCVALKPVLLADKRCNSR